MNGTRRMVVYIIPHASFPFARLVLFNRELNMRLANLTPAASTELVAHLNSIGIRTEIDLLFSATPWEILRRLPAGSTSLEDLDTFITLVTELCAAQGTSALKLLDLEADARVKDKELCSGDEQVDRLLRGLGGRKVIHISGERGSGKSVGTPRRRKRVGAHVICPRSYLLRLLH